MSVDKVFYNQASAAKLGWEPSWFGCEHNDEQLVVAIRKWQRKSKIASDGMSTHLDREASRHSRLCACSIQTVRCRAEAHRPQQQVPSYRVGQGCPVE